MNNMNSDLCNRCNEKPILLGIPDNKYCDTCFFEVNMYGTVKNWEKLSDTEKSMEKEKINKNYIENEQKLGNNKIAILGLIIIATLFVVIISAITYSLIIRLI
tara:strand:- start:208 stop:516 length:309 start_codon:yes stop_codon:yes gene_type:complete